jgi:hypothetical protein
MLPFLLSCALVTGANLRWRVDADGDGVEAAAYGSLDVPGASSAGNDIACSRE